MFNAISNHFQKYALIKTRTILQGMSDRQLADVGISRELLNQGVSQWPWREDSDNTTEVNQPAKMNTSQINSAIRELSDMTDKELMDLGISRGCIRDAVTRGPEGRAA